MSSKKKSKAPISADSLKEQGNNAFVKGKYDQAIELYTKAIQLQENNHILFTNRAACYLQLRNYQLALEDADKSIQINKQWAKGYLRKVDALLALKRLEEAKDAAKEGGSIDVELFKDLLANIIPRGIELQELYDKKLNTEESKSVTVRFTPEKGKSLFAIRDIQKGSTIFTEKPLVLIQKIDNKEEVIACSHCLKFMGIRMNNKDDLFTSHVKCSFGCDEEIYCSLDCQQSSLSSYHLLTCPNNQNGSISMSLYYNHSKKLSHRFLLLLKILGMIIQGYKGVKVELPFDEYLSSVDNPFRSFVKRSWINMSQYDPITKTSEHEEIAKQGGNLRNIKSQAIQESIQLLKSTKLYNDTYSSLFNFESISDLIGMIDMNGADIESIPNDKDRSHLKSLLNCDDDSELPHSIGTGLFLIHSCLNHSCIPNAEVIGGLIDQSDATIKINALKNIKKGDEILISYISDPDKHKCVDRRKELIGCYLFNCNCLKCTDES